MHVTLSPHPAQSRLAWPLPSSDRADAVAPPPPFPGPHFWGCPEQCLTRGLQLLFTTPLPDGPRQLTLGGYRALDRRVHSGAGGSGQRAARQGQARPTAWEAKAGSWLGEARLAAGRNGVSFTSPSSRGGCSTTST